MTLPEFFHEYPATSTYLLAVLIMEVILVIFQLTGVVGSA